MCLYLFLKCLTLSASHALVFSKGPKLLAESRQQHNLWAGNASLRTSISCTLMNAHSKELSLRAYLSTSSSPTHPHLPRFQPSSAGTQKQVSVWWVRTRTSGEDTQSHPLTKWWNKMNSHKPATSFACLKLSKLHHLPPVSQKLKIILAIHPIRHLLFISQIYLCNLTSPTTMVLGG